MAEEQKESVQSRAVQQLERYLGPAVMEALRDPKTIEVLLNPDGVVWVERLGQPMEKLGTMQESRASSIIRSIAGYHELTVTKDWPIVEAELPIDGARFSGQMPPIVQAPAFSIREKAVSIFTIDQYIESGVMTAHQGEVIKKAVRDHHNILVIGGTGSGKTTLINAILQEMVEANPHERFAVLEDLSELQCAAENKVQYHTTTQVPMSVLLKTILRMRPDRIIVGEVRGPEALDMMDAWNTGHDGGAGTLHANNPEAALLRLKGLVTRNPLAPSEIEPLIGEAVQLVVHIAKTPEGRRIQDILMIHGFSNGKYEMTSIQ